MTQPKATRYSPAIALRNGQPAVSAALASSVAALLLACAAASGQEVMTQPPDIAMPPETDPATAEAPMPDARVESLLITTYSVDRHLSAFDIGVRVEGESATLSGAVDTAEQRDLAARLALIPGRIVRVDNRLRVATPDAPAPRSNPFYRFVEQLGPGTQVKMQLLWHKPIDGQHLDVTTRGDTVVLFGEVPSEAAKALAERIARRTIGIGGVENLLWVRPDTTSTAQANQATTEPVSDDWITTRVTASLRLDRALHAENIAVSSDRGILTLSGNVPTTAEKLEAGDVAEAIDGVERVDNRLVIVALD